MNRMIAALAAGVGLAAMAAPAQATLQLSIDVNGTVVSCADGAACDQSATNKNLLVINETVDGVLVQLTLAQSVSGAINSLQLSSSNIINETGAPISISFYASDTSFTAPVRKVSDSGSLTFNQNVGAPNSSLSFFADALNRQGANPTNTPGTLLEQVFGRAFTDPDSFAGSNFANFVANGPFSMTESATLALRAGGSITGFNQSMTSSAIPEPSTWVMGIAGFGFLAAMGFKKGRKDRLASI